MTSRRQRRLDEVTRAMDEAVQVLRRYEAAFQRQSTELVDAVRRQEQLLRLVLQKQPAAASGASCGQCGSHAHPTINCPQLMDKPEEGVSILCLARNSLGESCRRPQGHGGTHRSGSDIEWGWPTGPQSIICPYCHRLGDHPSNCPARWRYT